MGLILLEAFAAGAVLILIVWWTMFSGRKRGEIDDTPAHKNGDAADADDKGAAQGPLTVKIYGDISSSQQDALCDAMSSMARRTGTRTSTVQFFALGQSVAPVSLSTTTVGK